MSTIDTDVFAILLPYFFGYKTELFFHPKQCQKSSTILQDGFRFLGLFRKGRTCIIAKLHRTNIVIRSHSREGKSPSYKSCKYTGFKGLLHCFFTFSRNIPNYGNRYL